MLAARLLGRSAGTRLVAGRCMRGADWRRAVHASAPALQLVTQNLPSLGDSITEGTLNSWAKKVGEKVAVDEVIAVIETDKVSVDLRVPVAGVLSKQMAVEGDTVQVGAALYVVDTEGQATVAPTSASAPAAAAAPAQPKAAAPAPAPTSTQHQSHGRKPLIKFLGKRSLLKQQPYGGQKHTQQQQQVQQAPKVVKHSPNAVDFAEVPGGAMYGRPPLTRAEIDYIESGGASMWG